MVYETLHQNHSSQAAEAARQAPILCRCGIRIDVSPSCRLISPGFDSLLAAPPPSTKHLTDEELKQQYGIHMTSRIEADGESKEAKWADIDDDEDDWAPETIEWADGTKVTLNHASNMPLPPGPGTLETPSEEQPKTVQPARPKPAQTISSVGPNATVLKLGASAERQQAQKATILQKGPLERESPSAAKSPAPVPSKSPWASLPPVEKVSPITINPQIPMPPSNRYGQVPQGDSSPSMAIAPSPAKEISADDFNRSWRDPQAGQPRELFMPNSGRYEAVNENHRRGSRNDQNFRAPALLQRPSHSDANAPAEPSPAFQTSRVSADQERGHWNRRRTSSIQSAGSGPFGRRMSTSRGADVAQVPLEMVQQQRISSNMGPADAVASSRGVHVQQNVNLPPTASTAGPPGQAPDMALVAEQKRLMQESARLAVQRRRDEELKEEEAKKARIRLKLEQMGPPPDHKSKAQEAKPEAAPHAEPVVAQVSSPPKPPVPEASGEPKQYGMMKVHHPDNVKKFSPQAEKAETSPNIKLQDVETPLQPDPVRSTALLEKGISLAGEAPSEHPASESRNDVFPGDEGLQSWKSPHTVNERVPGWNGRNHHPGPTTSNLWGPPNHDKALGNGTFDQRLTGLPARDLSMRNHSQQSNWLGRRLSSHEKSPQMPSMPPMPQENLQSVVSFPSPEQRPTAANSDTDSLQPLLAKAMPRGPPQTQIPYPRWQQPSNTRPANSEVAAWKNFHSVATREERAESERFQRELAAGLEEEARTGIRRPAQYTFNETWKKVELGDQAGDRQVTSVAKGNIDPSFPASNAYGAPGPGLNGDRAANGLPVRGSRFFPAEARRAITYSHPEVPRTPSPPPAEEIGGLHPAYDGDTKRPIINFPVPKAVVKLPQPPQRISPSPTVPAPPRTFAAAVAAQPPPTQPSLRAASQPLASTPDWQHRFNDLLGRKPPPKKQVLVVDSSSREPLDVMPPNVSAAVSLPPKEVDWLKDAGKVTSRDVEDEEDLFEDREAGSLPLVQIPRDVSPNLFQPTRAPHLRFKGRYFKLEVDPVSITPFDGTDDFARNTKGKEIVIFIHLPGTTQATKKILPRKGGNAFVSRGPKSHNSSNSNYNNNNKHSKKPLPKSRESSGSSPFPNAQQQQPNRGNNTRTPPAANAPVPPPRSGFSHNSHNAGWRGGQFASTGIAL